MAKRSNGRNKQKPLVITWAEAIDIGRTAIKDVSKQFTLNICPGSLYDVSDSLALLILSDLMGQSPNGSDSVSRLMGKISPRASSLPSADTVLAAVNSTGLEQLISDFRCGLSGQIAIAREQGTFKEDFIVAGDTHDVKRYSKLRIGRGKGKKRKRRTEDITFVVGTKPERGAFWAHKFITLASTGTYKYTLDVEPQLPFQSLPDSVSLMLDRTEALVGRRVDTLLWDGAAFSASFVSMMLGRKTHFVTRAPKNKKINQVISKYNGLFGGVEYGYLIDEKPNASVNLVIVSTDLLREKKLDMQLVDSEEKWITLATDLKPRPGESVEDFLIRMVKLYQKRWCVETSYRCIEDFHGFTHSLHYQTRLLLFVIAVLLYNIWIAKVIATRSKDDPRVTKHLLSFMLTVVLLLSWTVPYDEIKVASCPIDLSVPSDRGPNIG